MVQQEEGGLLMVIALLTLFFPGPPLDRHLVKFTYLGPSNSVSANSKHTGASYVSSRHVSQLLICDVTIQCYCDCSSGAMWYSEMSPEGPFLPFGLTSISWAPGYSFG